MVQLYPKPKSQSIFTEKNRELQVRLRIKKYGMLGLTVKMRAFLFVWLYIQDIGVMVSGVKLVITPTKLE